MKPGSLCFVLITGLTLAACEMTVKADLKPVKIKTLTVLAPEGTPQSRVDYMQTVLTGEFLKRGAVMDETGLDIKVATNWVGAGVALTAQAVDSKGISLSVAVSNSNLGLYRDETMLVLTAKRFADEMAAQIDSQVAKGRRPASLTQSAPTQGEVISLVSATKTE